MDSGEKNVSNGRKSRSGAHNRDSLSPGKGAPPLPTDQHHSSRPFPWYDSYNIYAKKTGTRFPNELIIVLSHKDSQSFLDCGPSANDNASGLSGTLEITRILNSYKSERSIWFIFVNEEHVPYTSETAAKKIAKSSYNVIGLVNIDGISGKSLADKQAGNMTGASKYITPEGEVLADLMGHLNNKYSLGLSLTKHKYELAKGELPPDDDGSFLIEGIRNTVMNVGSYPYVDPNYHGIGDTAETVDLKNTTLVTKLSLAAILYLDTHGKQNPGVQFD